jgi:hypothetical protein
LELRMLQQLVIQPMKEVLIEIINLADKKLIDQIKGITQVRRNSLNSNIWKSLSMEIVSSLVQDNFLVQYWLLVVEIMLRIRVTINKHLIKIGTRL